MGARLTLSGKKGKIFIAIERPESIQEHSLGKCPLVILMHGFLSSMNYGLLKALSSHLAKAGIATLRFDFDGHGRSDGKFSEMTVLTELDDARIVYDYAASLEWVKSISLLGHSQGGVVAGMTAGTLGADKIACLVQLAPAAVLKDDAIEGTLMGKRYDPANPPEHLHVFFHSVGKRFFQVAQNLDIYGASSKYTGPVCLIHGKADRIVPYSYSEQYNEVYENSVLHLLERENHTFSKNRGEAISIAVKFLERTLKNKTR